MKFVKSMLLTGILLYGMTALSGCTSCTRQNPSSSSFSSSSNSSSSTSSSSSISSSSSASTDTDSSLSGETETGTDTDSTGSDTTAPETSGTDVPGETTDTTDTAETTDTTDTSSTTDPSSNTSAAAAMSTDFSKIGALDAKKQGWGPGVQVDEKNRPIGATVFQEKYSQYNAHFIAPESDHIYLTFDEGYESEQRYTVKLLDTLKEKEVPAVFFVTYDYVHRNPDLVQRMIDEGHIVGNHSYSHPSMPDIPLEKAKEEFLKLHDYVKENFQYEMELFRFPMGEFNEQTLALAQELGYKSVFWSFAYQDWDPNNQMGYDAAFHKVTQRAHPGAIYLLHAVSKDNCDILPAVIDTLRSQGYQLVRYDVDYVPEDPDNMKLEVIN